MHAEYKDFAVYKNLQEIHNNNASVKIQNK